MSSWTISQYSSLLWRKSSTSRIKSRQNIYIPRPFWEILPNVGSWGLLIHLGTRAKCHTCLKHQYVILVVNNKSDQAIPGTTKGDSSRWTMCSALSTGSSNAGYRMMIKIIFFLWKKRFLISLRRMARKLQSRMCWRNPPKMSQAASTKLAEKPRGIPNFQWLDFLSFLLSFGYLPVFGICMLKKEMNKRTN